ncbi:MAG: polysaccharide deacetylase [Proteobacteria bacterium]|nr:polysaccharide deacetylase [Pseudomonadota bacterium]
MSAKLSIVMYHYVRDCSRTEWPRIKGLDVQSFRSQLDHIQKNYTVVDYTHLRSFIKEGEPLPRNPCWLTFDDGYLDHFEYVLPELTSRGLRASFFPAAKAVAENVLLDVNQIHFILASTEQHDDILAHIRFLVDEECRQNPASVPFDSYWNKYAVAGRYDSANVSFIKKVLQVGLVPGLRERVLDKLFEFFVSKDKSAFAERLYMSRDHLTELMRYDMHIGSHGYRHTWLNHMDKEGQADDIDRSLAFLNSLGIQTHTDWVMCYPYGGYDMTTLSLLEERNCLIGVTTAPGVAEFVSETSLTLSRLDTNDLPQS